MPYLDLALSLLLVAAAGGFLWWKIVVVPRRRKTMPTEDRVVLGPSLAKAVRKARQK